MSKKWKSLQLTSGQAPGPQQGFASPCPGSAPHARHCFNVGSPLRGFLTPCPCVSLGGLAPAWMSLLQEVPDVSHRLRGWRDGVYPVSRAWHREMLNSIYSVNGGRAWSALSWRTGLSVPFEVNPPPAGAGWERPWITVFTQPWHL